MTLEINMRAVLVLAIMLFAGFAHAQYDYDDDYKQKKTKTPKNTEETEDADDIEPAKVRRGNDGKGFEFNKMSVGGIFNFSYGAGYFDGYYEYSNILYLEISPIVTYQLIEKRLDIGAGVIYQFQKFDVEALNFASQEYKYHTYGGRIFPRVYIWQGLFAQLEYVVQNGDVTVFDPNNGTYRDTRMTFHNAFAGGGYSFPLGGAGYFALLVYINLNTNLLYPERRPFFSFGFGIGL